MRRVLITAVVFVGLCVLGLAVMLTETGLRVPPRPVSAARQDAAAALAKKYGAALSTISRSGSHAAELKAWDFRLNPASPTVIVLHGHGDNRGGMLGFTDMLLSLGYSVLVPDSRGHGDSTGDPLTFGVYEREDLQQWAEWASKRQQANCEYAIGVSMGAAIVIQSLPHTPQFCAAIAESPFASFRDIGLGRVAGQFGAVPLLPTALVGTAFVYARLRFGLDLDQASSVQALRNSTTPLLLIHGTADTNIPIGHTRLLLAVPRRNVEFWEVAGGEHVRIRSTRAGEYRKRVQEWFAKNSR